MTDRQKDAAVAVNHPSYCFEHSPLPMATMMGDTHVVTYANAAFCRLIGQAAPQFFGKPFHEILPDRDDCLTMLDRVYRSGEPANHIDEQQSEPHSVFWSYAIWPVPDSKGADGVAIQVAETARVHESTVAMNEALILGSLRQHELTEAAGLANAQLHKAEEVLRIAAERKNEFLAMLAHELRNPLAPIRYMLEILKRTGHQDAMTQRAVGTMERQLAQMTRLIDDLLDVSRISRGKLTLRRGDIELASVIHQAVEAARPACEAAPHTLTVTLPPEPMYLNADPARLVQVFGNLLNNACKFTAPGGRIALRAERQDGELVISVKDSGIGIAAPMLPRIFEMFMQADQTLERSIGGLGIGLTLVRRLVEMHGGSVQALSAGMGQGSEFVVRLPARLAQPDVVPAEPVVGEPVTLSARRILVVDDNHDAANTLSLLLKMSGHETATAFDGLDAVAAAATFKPDVVLLDIGLPKMNGYDAARQIRLQPGGKGLVLVAVTGWGQFEDRQKTAEAGFDGHMVKPVEYMALTTLIAGLDAAKRER